MFHPYLLHQKINNFEYLLFILFSVFGLFLLCSANDFLTAYLAIEVQSLSFYVLAAFNKKSTFSADAGIKYFILGSFASSLFLFGISLIYGVSGSVCFDDFNLLFTSSSFSAIDSEKYLESCFYEIMEQSYKTHKHVCFNYFEEKELSFFFVYPQFPALTYIQFLNFCSSCESSNYFCHFLNLDLDVGTGLIKFALVLILIALLFKLTVAPFHLWAPDVYEGSPSSSTFFFSVVPKLSIFVLLLRIFYYSFFEFVESWRYFIVVIVIFSIFVGSFGGINQKKTKKFTGL